MSLPGGYRTSARLRAPYSSAWSLHRMQAFRGPAPPTSRAPLRVAPPGGPHEWLGRCRRSPAPPYPSWRPATLRWGPIPSKRALLPLTGSFGRGNDRYQPEVYSHRRTLPRKSPSGPGDDQRGFLRASPLETATRPPPGKAPWSRYWPSPPSIRTTQDLQVIRGRPRPTVRTLPDARISAGIYPVDPSSPSVRIRMGPRPTIVCTETGSHPL